MHSLNSYCVLSTTSPHFTLRATAEETKALNLRTLLSHKRWELTLHRLISKGTDTHPGLLPLSRIFSWAPLTETESWFCPGASQAGILCSPAQEWRQMSVHTCSSGCITLGAFWSRACLSSGSQNPQRPCLAGNPGPSPAPRQRPGPVISSWCWGEEWSLKGWT